MEAVSLWDLCKITVLSHVSQLLGRKRRFPLKMEDAEACAPAKRRTDPVVPSSARLALAPSVDAVEETQEVLGACALLYLRKSSAP